MRLSGVFVVRHIYSIGEIKQNDVQNVNTKEILSVKINGEMSGENARKSNLEYVAN
jgi:hypothetical protein